uniref:KASH domain-containing protein n=1 Tax=Electrophorus electricus TaxID=8005 RepID=A0A4W4FPQ2_ELEEL
MVQQLDKNMSNLRTWLSRIEGELAKPIVYRVCHGDEIQRKLAEQQELQRDIEQHTEGVASVLTLCDVLLHDTDACGSDAENDSIQQTTHSLDRRWRNICAMSMERRMRIEETWRLWSKFMEDYSRFEEWLSAAERTAANPASADVLYTCAKEELKKFEAFQRQVHERLTQLELVNKQYRRLARENRTDTASKLKMMVNEGNQRWDTLQRRVTAVLRRLKHFTSQRDDFEGSREAILMWLTEMDLQLTNVEHFSESDIRDKMRQLDAFRQEITLNTDKIDALIVFGENLIQKSCPVDAVLIEEELEEMHSYCQEVFGRVDRFHRRLVLRRPVLDEEYDFSDRDADVEDSLELETEWARGGSSSTQRAECHGLLPPPLQPSGRDTPGSVDSIPLEWDHTVDVGGSSSPEDEEEVTYYSALSGTEPLVQPLVFKLVSGLKPGVIERWELLGARQACVDRDVLRWGAQSQHGMGAELDEVTVWLDSVLPELDRLRRTDASGSIRDMETSVRELKEMQRTFSSYKALMIGVNLSGRDLQHGDNAELDELREGLRAANQKWMCACASLDSWEGQLQRALLECQVGRFHETLHSLLLWLARAESQRYMVNIHDHNVDTSLLQEHRNTLRVGKYKMLSLLGTFVRPLQEISSHILQLDQGDDSLEAKEKVHVIGNKLRLLLRQVTQDLSTLQARLVSVSHTHKLHTHSTRSVPLWDAPLHPPHPAHPGHCSSVQHTNMSPTRPLLYRVLRAALPIHVLLLLVLALACLVPPSEDDYSCALSNTFARSFYPMLRYTNGPPPT